MKIVTEYNISDLVIYEDGCGESTSRIVGIRTTTDAKLTTKTYYELNNGAVVDENNHLTKILQTGSYKFDKDKKEDEEISNMYLKDQGVT